jgi:lycopene elongase/hydratase (dihydrobisanhydrobacterioruberin-forming)
VFVAEESGIRITKELRVSPSDLTELIVSLGGVKFWIVAVAPLYIGWVLGQPEATRHLFIDDLSVVLGIVVVGPLLGTFTLLLNVYYDMRTTDRVNPRKKYVRVVEELIGEGLMEPDTLLLAAFGFAATGLVLAAYISGSLVHFAPSDVGGPLTAFVGGYGFLLLTILIILLSVAYSLPRVHWKGVAGMDLLTNMVGFGVLCPLCGWSLLRPIESAPWWFIGTIALFLGALYAPTTASDYAADRTFGIGTMAVRWGVSRTLQIGFGFQLLSAIALAVGWSQRWFPFDGPAYAGMAELWPFLALQVAFYAIFLRRPTVGRIWALLLFLSILQALGVLLMLWRFVGERAWPP